MHALCLPPFPRLPSFRRKEGHFSQRKSGKRSTWGPLFCRALYRAEKKSLQILLSSTQAGPGRKVRAGRNFSQPRTKTFSRLCTASEFNCPMPMQSPTQNTSRDLSYFQKMFEMFPSNNSRHIHSLSLYTLPFLWLDEQTTGDKMISFRHD